MHEQTTYDVEIQASVSSIARMIVEAHVAPEMTKDAFEFFVKRSVANFEDFVTCGMHSPDEDTVLISVYEGETMCPSQYRYDCNNCSIETYAIFAKLISAAAYWFHCEAADSEEIEAEAEAILNIVKKYAK